MFLSDYCSPEYLDDMAEKLFSHEDPSPLSHFRINGIPYEKTNDALTIGELVQTDNGTVVQINKSEEIEVLKGFGARVIKPVKRMGG